MSALKDRLKKAEDKVSGEAPTPATDPSAPTEKVEYDFSGAPAHVQAILPSVAEDKRFEVAQQLGFIAPVKAPPAPPKPALPPQTAPVNPPEMSLETAPTPKKGKESKAEGSKAAAVSGALAVDSILNLGLGPGEEAVFAISISISRVK